MNNNFAAMINEAIEMEKEVEVVMSFDSKNYLDILFAPEWINIVNNDLIMTDGNNYCGVCMENIEYDEDEEIYYYSNGNMMMTFSIN